MKGAELRRLREINQKTLEQVAEPMGVSRQAVAQIEGRGDVLDDTAARYLGAMLDVAEVVVETVTAFRRIDNRPLYIDDARYTVRVKE